MASTDTIFDTDCVLMLHMDGADASTAFTDSSTSAKTVTVNGNTQIDTSQSVFGGASGLFDGTGDYLSLADSADWDFGSGDFTWDLRFRPADDATLNTFMATEDGTAGVIFQANSATDRIFAYSDDLTQYAFLTAIDADTWYHIAIVRSGNTLYGFKDGTQITTHDVTGKTFNGTAATLKIGRRNSGSNELNGWLDEFRLVKGTAVWTANFTPPSAAYVAPGGTKKLALLGVG